MSNIRRDDVDKFFDYSLYVPARALYMGGEVDEVQAELFLKGMALLEPGGAPIRIIMNNPGGDEYHGLAIYDAIATSQCNITITAYGHAMSMGSWILQAADERVLAPNCTVMIHYGSYPVNADLTRQEVAAMSRETKRFNAMMERVYLQRMKERDPGMTLHKLRGLIDRESYFTAEEAVKLGLADRILEVMTARTQG